MVNFAFTIYIPPNIEEIYLEKNKGYIINLKQKSFSLSLLQPLYWHFIVMPMLEYTGVL